MITPGRTLCLLAILPAGVALFLFLDSSAWPVVAALDVLIFLVALMDLFTLPRRHDFRVRRSYAHVATRGVRHPMTLILENRSNRTHAALVKDDHPPGLADEFQSIKVVLAPRARNHIHYAIVPKQRGTFSLDWVWVGLNSRLGLWSKTLKLSLSETISVYPALKQISRYALYSRLNRMSLLGVRKSRRIQSDNEFERLRDYTPDDSFRSIDWRATSRRQKLTVRDFQSNQSQRIVFLVDCGRMMVNESAGQSLLDAAFDAALTLGYVALAQHDEAGLLCFSDRILRWIPPRGGKQQLNRMVQAVHDVHPELVESRFDLAFLHLLTHCRKRTLSILITNVMDDRNATQIKAQLSNLVGRHLPMAVLLRDRDLFDAVETASEQVPHPRESNLYRAGAAADILCWRQQVLLDLRHGGVLTLDTFPEKLTAPLVNEYLRIKSHHLL